VLTFSAAILLQLSEGIIWWAECLSIGPANLSLYRCGDGPTIPPPPPKMVIQMSGRVMDEKEQTGNKKKRSAVLKFSLCVCLYHLAQSPSLEPDLGRAVLCRGGLLYPLEESTNNDVFASAQLTRRPGSLLAAAAAAQKKRDTYMCLLWYS
jgi:hypothetical protein